MFRGRGGRDAFLPRGRGQSDIDILPPIQLLYILNPAFMEPFLQSQTDEEMRIRMRFFDLQHRRMGEMVVMAVRYHDQVYDW